MRMSYDTYCNFMGGQLDEHFRLQVSLRSYTWYTIHESVWIWDHTATGVSCCSLKVLFHNGKETFPDTSQLHQIIGNNMKQIINFIIVQYQNLWKSILGNNDK